MDLEHIRLTGLAIFVIWVPAGSRYVSALANGQSGEVIEKYIAYGGALLQVIVCAVVLIAFPGTVYFIAVATELSAMAAIIYVLNGRRKGHRRSKQRIIRRLPDRLLVFLRKNSVVICAMAISGAGFVAYAAPFV